MDYLRHPRYNVTATEANLYDLEGNVIAKVPLPRVFYTPIRPDLIKRAYLSALTKRIQPQGRDPMAGKRTSAECWGVGYGVSRVPRVKGEHHPAANRAAFVTMAVGGRRAHAPTSEKIVAERINKKERRLAIMSAIAATAVPFFVKSRGHVFDEERTSLPIVVRDDLEKVKRTKEMVEVLKNLGLYADVERAKNGIKIRAGKGKMRGRRYKKPKSLLIVYLNNDGIVHAARNLPGVDVVNIRNVSVLHLAPGAKPARLTVWSESAFRMLEELF